MSLLTLNHKFLLDENVKAVLSRFLKSEGFDVKLAPKTTSDSKLALLSKEELRILVTNDEDFQWYSDKEIYSVILLKVPQNDNESLIKVFNKLLSEFNNFAGRIVVLDKNGAYKAQYKAGVIKTSIKEAINTAKYAFSVGSDEVAFESAFIQEGTCMEKMYRENKFKPPWLWSVIEVIKQTHDLGSINEQKVIEVRKQNNYIIF